MIFWWLWQWWHIIQVVKICTLTWSLKGFSKSTYRKKRGVQSLGKVPVYPPWGWHVLYVMEAELFQPCCRIKFYCCAIHCASLINYKEREEVWFLFCFGLFLFNFSFVLDLNLVLHAKWLFFSGSLSRFYVLIKFCGINSFRVIELGLWIQAFTATICAFPLGFFSIAY